MEGGRGVEGGVGEGGAQAGSEGVAVVPGTTLKRPVVRSECDLVKF